MDGAYPKGPGLSEFFKSAKPLDFKEVQKRLPAMFDDLCTQCKKPMEFMPVTALTRQTPFATFQCPHCKRRLMLFEAPITPLFVWSDELHDVVPKYADYFSLHVEERIANRPHKQDIKAARYGVWGYLLRMVFRRRTHP